MTSGYAQGLEQKMAQWAAGAFAPAFKKLGGGYEEGGTPSSAARRDAIVDLNPKPLIPKAPTPLTHCLQQCLLL